MSEQFVIKIYLPKKTKEKFLYGHKKTEHKLIERVQTLKTLISFYVITSTDKKFKNTELEFLGTIGDSVNKTDAINILINQQNQVTKVLLSGVLLTTSHRIILLNYDRQQFLQCYDELYSESSVEENFSLFIAKALKDEQDQENSKSLLKVVSNKLHNCIVQSTSIASKFFRLLSPIFHNTVIYRHCSNWRRCLIDERSKDGFVILDVLLGVMFFTLMNHVQHSGMYFMGTTEIIVNKLRGLLEMFDGSPVGLKLNVQLNNFLLSCFMYHVDLWWNFIVIVEPAIHYLFLPITMFGLMGFSFQCAMICDVITLITLHAHCFYIYAAMLYKLELSSIRSLLRIVLGRRLNVLKSKIFLANKIIENLFFCF